MKGYPTYPSSRAYFRQVATLLEDLDAQCDRFVATLYRGFEEKRTVFLCGNGGSAANASHFGQDLAKGTLSSMAAVRRFRVIPLTDNIGFITALANDEGYDRVFSGQLENFAGPGDLFVAISASGSSPNLIEAVELARERGVATVGLLGFDGGTLKGLVDECLWLPTEQGRYGVVESGHSVLCDILTACLTQDLALPAAVQRTTDTDA